jgi:hypothetical protein
MQKILSIIILAVSLMIPQTFADSQITLNTNKDSFSAGDLVDLTGKLSGAQNQLVAIEVKDPTGQTVLTRAVQTDSGGNFELQFKIPSYGTSGNYDIIANAKVNGNVATATKTISQSSQSTSAKGGGCLIATAAFGSELAPQVQMLREIRDNQLLHTQAGTGFMTGFNSFYYSFSPTVADWERQNPVFKEMVKDTITPLITSLTILQYVPINSEATALFYGIGIILLNIGMYFVAPTVVVLKIKNRVIKKKSN